MVTAMRIGAWTSPRCFASIQPMKAALPHVFPQWEPPEDDPGAPSEDWGQMWYGKMRIVHRQRARKLRRRGVPLMNLRHRNAWAWFVEPEPLSAATIVNGALRRIGAP